MRNALLFAGMAAAVLGLTGCGEVNDKQTYPHVAVQVTRGGRPLAGKEVSVAIRTHREQGYTVPQPVTTNGRGLAMADFPAQWGNVTFTFPTKRTVPPEAPKPTYLISAGGQQFAVTPKSPNTTYHWNGERWETQTVIELP